MPAQHRSWIVLFCLLLLASLPIAAQVSASLSGRVTGPDRRSHRGRQRHRAESGHRGHPLDHHRPGRALRIAGAAHRPSTRFARSRTASLSRSAPASCWSSARTRPPTCSLQVGKVTEQVKVESNVPVVNTTTQDISGLIGEKEIKDAAAERAQLRSAARR